jgi:hypothetical protein
MLERNICKAKASNKRIDAILQYILLNNAGEIIKSIFKQEKKPN